MDVNKTLTNFVVTDEFSEEVKKYFDFSIVNKEDADVVETTTNGYTWKINNLSANTTATLKFKLTLKDSSKIEEIDTYKNINTSANMNVQYKDIETAINYDVTESPIILICEKYSVTIQAVSEENNNLPVEGIDVNIIAKKEDGKIVYSGTETTNSSGKVTVDNLKTLGKLTFTITPQVNKVGYQASSGIEFETYNNQTGKTLSVTTDSMPLQKDFLLLKYALLHF